MDAPQKNEIRASRDFGQLASLLQGLVGQPCLHAELSHGDELVVHFGQAMPYAVPSLAGEVYGSWELSGRGTPYRIEEAVATLAGSTVEAVTLSDAVPPDLTLRFQDGSVLVIMASDAAPDASLAVWELSMPDGMCLKVWGRPAPAWSLLRSDRPL